MGHDDAVSRRIRQRHVLQTADGGRTRNIHLGLISVTLVLLAATTWSYWPTMAALFKEWQSNDDYSAGQLVPLVALFLVWRDRKTLRTCPLTPCWWGGITLLLLALTARLYGLLFMFESADRYSLILTITGLVLMVAGWQVVRRTSWILLFLFLMVPFPGRIHNLISGPLQRLATTGSVFLLEVFLPHVSRQGNVVMLNENTPMAVAEACGGLRMLTAFIIVAAFIAYVVRRSRSRKIIVVMSSIPIGILCNILRIFVTALLVLLAGAEVAEKFFHDFAGFVMMPAAVLLIFGELWLMDRLLLPEPSSPHEKASRQARSGA
jgi:exosortase